MANAAKEGTKNGTVEKRVPHGAIRILATKLEELASLTDDDVVARIIARDMMAASEEELLAESAPLDAEDVLGETVLITDITIVKSDIEEDQRIPFYASFSIKRNADTEDVVNCGGEQVLGQAYWLLGNRKNSDGSFEPIAVTFIKVGKEKTGRKQPYRLTWPRV